jgi:hypothetical protein
MPRDGAIIFGDLIGKAALIRVTCDKCGREGYYPLRGLIRVHGTRRQDHRLACRDHRRLPEEL